MLSSSTVCLAPSLLHVVHVLHSRPEQVFLGQRISHGGLDERQQQRQCHDEPE